MSDHDSREQNRNIRPEISPEGAAPEETDSTLCVVCRERERDLTESPHSRLCTQCRDRQIKLRVPTGIVLFLLALCAVFVLALVALSDIWPSFRTVIQADQHMDAKEYRRAYDGYASVLSDYGDSLPIAVKGVEAAIRAQYFSEAAVLFNNHIFGKEVNDADYARLTGYLNFLTRFLDTNDAVALILDEATESHLSQQSGADNPDAPFTMRAMLEIQRKLKLLLEDPSQEKSLVYYFLASIGATNERETLEFLRLASEEDSYFTTPLSYYATSLRRTGDLKTARLYYEKALMRNADNVDAKRGLSILSLLEGDAAQGLATIREAYAIDPEAPYMLDTLLVALQENGEAGEAQALLATVPDQENLGDGELPRFLDGQITLHDYYID